MPHASRYVGVNNRFEDNPTAVLDLEHVRVVPIVDLDRGRQAPRLVCGGPQLLTSHQLMMANRCLPGHANMPLVARDPAEWRVGAVHLHAGDRMKSAPETG